MTTKITRLLTSIIIERLVHSQYDEIIAFTKGRRSTVDQIQTTISEYGRTLTMPPAAAYTNHLEVYELYRHVLPSNVDCSWSIEMPLWTEEEGESDLCIRTTISQTSDAFEAELDGILVP